MLVLIRSVVSVCTVFTQNRPFDYNIIAVGGSNVLVDPALQFIRFRPDCPSRAVAYSRGEGVVLDVSNIPRDFSLLTFEIVM